MNRTSVLAPGGRPLRRLLERRARRERGESLVELLITIVIMSIAVVAVVGALAVSIRISDIHRKQATAGAAVRAFAEALQARVAAGGYVPCADPATAYPLTGPNPVYTAPTGYAASYPSDAAAYWSPSAQAFQSTCTSDSGVQRISLRVESDDHSAAETLDVVLRLPCRAGDPCSL
jgi:type II secretory pathway pseudopilin PulG